MVALHLFTGCSAEQTSTLFSPAAFAQRETSSPTRVVFGGQAPGARHFAEFCQSLAEESPGVFMAYGSRDEGVGLARETRYKPHTPPTLHVQGFGLVVVPVDCTL